MTKEELFLNVNQVEKIGSTSKLQRMLAHPLRYFHAILFRELVYKRNKQEKEVVSTTFFDATMNIFLPSSTDIYLTGGKTHLSEIKLAKFLINTLNKGDLFLDIGAHYGYFSLLASSLVGKKGKVIAFEASPVTFQMLNKNQARMANMTAYNHAISDSSQDLIFYEFPNLYSEYNTLDVSQFENEAWFQKSPPTEITVKSTILDQFLKKENRYPKVIKIDVEGAEFRVLNGAATYLKQSAPIIAMEYLSNERGNESHVEAEKLLKSFGYTPHIINENGTLQTINKINNYLSDNKLESDNIVFVKVKSDIPIPLNI